MKTSYLWMKKDIVMIRVAGAHKVLVKILMEGVLKPFLTKTTDDVLVSGRIDYVVSLFEKLEARFTVRKSIITERTNFNGLVVEIRAG